LVDNRGGSHTDVISQICEMKLQYEIIHKNEIDDSHRSTFANLLKLQGKVKGNLLDKADRCMFICIVTLNNKPVAIGGIKPSTNADFKSDKSDLLAFESVFNWELGYIYTNKDHSGKGIASTLVRILLEEFGSENIMASTEITANPGMIRILEKNGFRHFGKPWKSGIHDNYLGLFLKFK
jgi:GNAT superfamily N-acetyltransferase